MMVTALASDNRIDDVVARLDLDDWMARWRAMQGGSDRLRHMDQIASVLPFQAHHPIDVLDMCCGPGDLGRTVRKRFADARIDFVDRDPFFLGLCRALEARAGGSGRVVQGDLWSPAWHAGCGPRYDTVTLANALHWFDDERLLNIFAEVHGLLRPGGVFAFLEPVSPVPSLASAHAAWVEAAHPGETTRYASLWDAFWDDLRAEVGFDWYAEVTTFLPSGKKYSDQQALHVVTFLDRLREAGFATVEVVARDAWSVVIVAGRGR